MVAGLIILLVSLEAIHLYKVYEPFLDVVECGGHRWLVIWYNTRTEAGQVRDYKNILDLDGGD